MIKRININGLFGRFNYVISTNPNGITIITGPNGFGKSTILRIINAISNANLSYFFELDFSSLIVEFDNQQNVTISKEHNKISIDGVSLSFLDEDSIKTFPRRPWVQRFQDGFIDRRDDEFFTKDEMFYKVYLDNDEFFYNHYSDKKRKNIETIKSKLDQVKEWCGEVRFISDQRLIRTFYRSSDEPHTVDVIQELPQRLKTQISKVSEEYSRVANRLDSSYPKRLFAAREGIKNSAEYQACLDVANEKFKKLNMYNLVDMTIIDEKNYNPQYSTALKIYFDDFSQKYKVFQDLVSKLDLFTRIINSRLTFKHLQISSENGFVVVDDDDPSKPMQLSQLSSGEKQEIVLFYELIFDTEENLLLLIDEPEISLHITWQKQFLDDLLEVSKQIDLQIIVATHSPQIVSNHLDIQIDLGELYGK